MPTETTLPLRAALSRLRERRPLVHNITNFVVMNWTANVLLALGASPVMAHAPEEVEDFAAMAGALVVNIGTLDAPFINAMTVAAKRAATQTVPWILDPVGVGATQYRSETAMKLMEYQPTILRGNAGEILALGGKTDGASKGVDSLAGSDAAVDAAKRLAARTGSVVVVTGATDYVVAADRIASVDGGHAMSQQVTGTGCATTAVIGAFLAIAPAFDAALHGLSVMKRAAARAAGQATGPGSFAVHLLDAIAADTGEA
ncbi:MAG: hydroxyethylthiazole kinase [Bosea sp. (in: a-proteobacteria)]